MPSECSDFKLAGPGDVEDQVIHSSGTRLDGLPNSDPKLEQEMLIDCGVPVLDEKILWIFALWADVLGAVGLAVGTLETREIRSRFSVVFGVEVSLPHAKLRTARSMRSASNTSECSFVSSWASG